MKLLILITISCIIIIITIILIVKELNTIHKALEDNDDEDADDQLGI